MTIRSATINLGDLELQPGAVWAYEGDDLDVNLLSFTPETPVAEHVNDEVDVVGVVLQGEAELRVDEQVLQVGPGSVFYIEKGSRRSLTPLGAFVYVSCHKRRRGLWPGEPPV